MSLAPDIEAENALKHENDGSIQCALVGIGWGLIAIARELERIATAINEHTELTMATSQKTANPSQKASPDFGPDLI